MSSPLVSVAVVTYNHGNYIRQCLEGVIMQQTNFLFEIIVGEDCSTDDTRMVVQEFENKYPDIIKPIYHAKNVGGARNAYEFCYPKLSGKYIAVCEGDDFWTDPLKLQKQIDFLEQNEGYSLCFHRVNTVNQINEVIDTQLPLAQTRLYESKEIFHISIPTLSAVFRNCIESFPEEMMRVQSGDTFLFGMLSTYGNAADLGFVGASYRKHMGGVYNGKSTVEQFRQTIYTRKLMKSSAYFNTDQKKEIAKELRKRKKLYIKSFIQKRQLLNCLKIIFT
jgi:glycosyltransferase involved in cell wall biosynthesis